MLTNRKGQLIPVGKGYSNNSVTVRTYLTDTTKFYISYSSLAAKDSMEIQWRTYTAKCCGEKYTAYEIKELKFNSIPVKPLNNIYTFIK